MNKKQKLLDKLINTINRIRLHEREVYKLRGREEAFEFASKNCCSNSFTLPEKSNIKYRKKLKKGRRLVKKANKLNRKLDKALG